MKGPASKPTGLFSPMVDIGDFFVEGYLKSQSKENLAQILEVLTVEQADCESGTYPDDRLSLDYDGLAQARLHRE
jgi:hypothetical protein